jgi:site-specific DNA recombinase
MKPTKLKAAGYVRVSGKGQIENESLPEQRELIQSYCKQHGHKLVNIYADEGISGATTADRAGMLQCLEDARAGKFQVLIIRDTTRFGRDLLEILQNQRAFENAGVELVAVKEDIQNTLYFQIKGMFAEQERKDIKQRMTAGRIHKARRGIPTNGTLPFGRTFDKEKEVWGIELTKKKAIEWIADEYLKGGSLRELARQVKPRYDFDITYAYLTTVLKKHCGEHWEINFEEASEPITFEIPRLLSERTIRAVKDRLAYNRTNNRTDDTRAYLLTGFIRCLHCGRTLQGQVQHSKYMYYTHAGGKFMDCKPFTTLPLKEVEQTVFEMIFEDIGDIVSFEKNISRTLPDTDYIHRLDAEIERLQKDVKQISSKLEKLIDLAIEGALDKDTIRAREQTYIKAKEKAAEELAEKIHQRDSLPDVAHVKAQAERIRKQLLKKYKSIDRLHEMTFTEKRELLHFLFDGKDPNGKHYGIYVDKKGSGKDARIIYHLYGRLRALKHNPDDGGKGGRTRLFEVKPGSPNSDNYKTNNFSSRQKYKRKTGCNKIMI